MDIFHARRTTDQRDKVFALLGRCLGDPRVANLVPDYNAPWKSVFEKAIAFSLSNQVTIRSHAEKEFAMISSMGQVLGQVPRVTPRGYKQ